MSDFPACPKCGSIYTYQDREQFVCPECAHEWIVGLEPAEHSVHDVNGQVLNSGDAVTVIRDLKVKGSSSVIKVGTKVKNIRVLDPEHVVDGHDIDCKIDGFGAMKLRGIVVKKA